MPKESLPRTVKKDPHEKARLLAPQTQMRMVLEIFDLGKDNKKNEERRKKFIDLISKYHGELIKKRQDIISDERRTKIHNQILDILKNMSLSLGLTEDQRNLTEYLAHNRDEVEKMIVTYFLGYNPSDPQEQSELKQAMRGGGYFGSVPGKEDE